MIDQVLASNTPAYSVTIPQDPPPIDPGDDKDPIPQPQEFNDEVSLSQEAQRFTSPVIESQESTPLTNTSKLVDYLA